MVRSKTLCGITRSLSKSVKRIIFDISLCDVGAGNNIVTSFGENEIPTLVGASGVSVDVSEGVGVGVVSEFVSVKLSFEAESLLESVLELDAVSDAPTVSVGGCVVVEDPSHPDAIIIASEDTKKNLNITRPRIVCLWSYVVTNMKRPMLIHSSLQTIRKKI